MNIEISSGSLWNSSRYFEFKIEITGAGTIDDPYLLSTKDQFSTESYEVRISDSSKYIKFSGFSLKAVYLRQCKNVRISKARI